MSLIASAQSLWCVTEFASALGIKQRTGQFTKEEAQVAWENFLRLCTNDLTLLSPEPEIFHKAALLTLDTTTGLRAGDALHLASVLRANVKRMAALGEIFTRNAKKRKIAVSYSKRNRHMPCDMGDQ